MSSICNFCNIVCDNNSILCDICNNWCHFSCIKLTKRQIKELSSSEDPFFCQMCICKNLPFSGLTKVGFMAAFKEFNSRKKSKCFPCLLCDKECENIPKKQSHRSVQCDSCKRWTHQICSSMNNAEFDLISMDNSSFFCQKCLFKFIPCQHLSKSQIQSLGFNNSFNEVNIDFCSFQEHAQYIKLQSVHNTHKNLVTFLYLNIQGETHVA